MISKTGNKTKYYRLSKNTNRQEENRPTSYGEFSLKTTGINWYKGGIGQKGFFDNSEDLQNTIGPYTQILQIKKAVKTFSNNKQIQLHEKKFENYRK